MALRIRLNALHISTLLYTCAVTACGGNVPQSASASAATLNPSTDVGNQQPAPVATPQGSARVSGTLGGVGIKPLQAIYLPIDTSFGGSDTEVIVGEQEDLCAAQHYETPLNGNIMRIEIFNQAGALDTNDYTVVTLGYLRDTQDTHWSLFYLAGVPTGSTDPNGKLIQATGGTVSITALPASDANTLDVTFTAQDPAGGAGLTGQVTAVLCPDVR